VLAWRGAPWAPGGRDVLRLRQSSRDQGQRGMHDGPPRTDPGHGPGRGYTTPRWVPARRARDTANLGARPGVWPHCPPAHPGGGGGGFGGWVGGRTGGVGGGCWRGDDRLAHWPSVGVHPGRDGVVLASTPRLVCSCVLACVEHARTHACAQQFPRQSCVLTHAL